MKVQMSQNLNPSSTFMLTTWMLLCIFFTRNIDAGKGKVPIYMPIPIPIPMPIGPSGGGGKFHHHHHQQQQQQQNDGEGEVKKIYLLQPMPKVQPPAQLKGGYVGPVQTHIHMPSPVVQHGPKPRPASYSGGHESSDGHNGRAGGHKSYPEMKILPILVIPPIAPMPPIQVPSSNTNSHAPRMTLTPQFNNYVVSSGEPGSRSSKVGRHHISASVSSYPQDDKSFSDYGASFGSSIHRGSLRQPRGRSARSRHAGRQTQIHPYYRSSASRSQPNWYEDQRDGEIGDYDDYDSRRPAYQPRGRTRLGSASRHRSFHEPNDSRSRSSNSIRDIINQQTLFDDEQSYQIEGGGGGSGEAMNRLSKQQVDCCSENLRLRQLANNLEAHSSANTEQREASALVDRDYSDQRDQMVRSRPQDSSDEADGRAELRKSQIESLNNAYYDRDLLDDEPRQPTNHQSGGYSNGRRLYLSERDIFDDDQWLFDTIKSVSHVDPPTNATRVANKTIETKELSTTTTPTTIVNNNDSNHKSNQ